MADLQRFLKKNKIIKTNTFFEATKSLTDEDGNPLKWEIRPITTKVNAELQDECIVETRVGNRVVDKLDIPLYLNKLVCKAVVEPNLYNAELQDSYGVKTPEELIKEMIDNPEEYNALVSFVQTYSGFNETITQKVDEAKN